MYSKAQKTISYITIKERQKKNKKTCKRDKKNKQIEVEGNETRNFNIYITL